MKKTFLLFVILGIFLLSTGCLNQNNTVMSTNNESKTTKTIQKSINSKTTSNSSVHIKQKQEHTLTKQSDQNKHNSKNLYIAKPVILTKSNTSQAVDTTKKNNESTAVDNNEIDEKKVNLIASKLPDFFTKNQVDWSWINTAYELKSITSNGKIDIAVGTEGIIKRSLNDKNWDTIQLNRNINFTKVIWFRDKFIAFGEKGLIFLSKEGKNWSSIQSQTIENFLLAVAGSNRVVAITDQGSVVISEDGEHWSKLDISFQKQIGPYVEHYIYYSDMRQLYYENGDFIFTYGGSSFISSNDGEKWLETSLPFNNIEGIFYKDSTFFAYGDTEMVLQSQNLKEWKYTKSNFGLDINKIIFSVNNSPIITLTQASGECGMLTETDDGIHWNVLGHNFCTVNSMIQKNDRLIGVGSDGTIVKSQDKISQWVMNNASTNAELKWDFIEQKLGYIENFVKNESKMIVSSYELDHSIVQTMNSGNWGTHQAKLNNFMSESTSYNLLFQSDDIIQNIVGFGDISDLSLSEITNDREKENVIQSTMITLDNVKVFIDPSGMTKMKNIYAMIGRQITTSIDSGPLQYQAIFISKDHLKNFIGVFKSKTNLNDIVASDHQLVVVGDHGLIASSTDGNKWTIENLNTEENINKVLWTGIEFIAVGNNGIISTSKDGSEWNTVQLSKTLDLSNITWNDNSYLVSDKYWKVFAVSKVGLDWTLFNNNLDISISTIHGDGRGYIAAGDGVVPFYFKN